MVNDSCKRAKLLLGEAMALDTKCPRCTESFGRGLLQCDYCGHLHPGERVAFRARRIRRLWMRLGGAVALLGLVGVAVGAQGYEEHDPPASFASANVHIVSVRPYANGLLVSADLETAAGPADLMLQVASIADDISRAVADGATELEGDARWITLQTTTPTFDQEGRPGRRILISLIYRVADIRARNNASAGPFDMLNAANEIWVSHPVGDGPVHAFCRDFAMPAKRFCAVSI